MPQLRLAPNPRPVSLALLVALLAIPTPPSAETDAVTPELTPKLERLLRQEMQAILGAMDTLFEGIVTGDHATVADKARRIHDSFILKRSLTAQDRKDLKAAVPPRFLELDKRFHKAAAKLAEAAEERDVQRELAIYTRMSRACVTCHSDYVTKRFPGLRARK